MRTSLGSVYKLDFYIESLGKIIEFDGDYWHGKNKERIANPSKVKNRDIEILKTRNDLKIYHVKECDYKNNPGKVINECLEFLKN